MKPVDTRSAVPKYFDFCIILENIFPVFPPGGGKILGICLLYAKEKSVSLHNFKKNRLRQLKKIQSTATQINPHRDQSCGRNRRGWEDLHSRSTFSVRKIACSQRCISISNAISSLMSHGQSEMLPRSGQESLMLPQFRFHFPRPAQIRAGIVKLKSQILETSLARLFFMK